jgi:Domain of unknown function (DUF1844)
LADPKHEKQEESFRVIDRRLFNSEGQIREEALREEREEKVKPAPEAKPSAPPATDAAPEPVPSPAGAAAPEPAPLPAIPSSRGFEMLVNFVAQNAAMLLGAYPDPRTGQAMLDLEGARELIDMLIALRDASRGNLSPDDDRLLLDVLGSLQLSFMEMTKAAAKAMQDKAKARP